MRDEALPLALTTACSGLGVAVCEDFEAGAWDGMSFYDTQTRAATDLWIDDVAVDGARIGCGP